MKQNLSQRLINTHKIEQYIRIEQGKNITDYASRL